MQRFAASEVQLLVATTVIEVGVDVPNASLMVIENAERMGLAQLHQLRGRVGRGTHESSCVLLYRAPLSEMARERLAAIRDTNDGFEIARRDLKLRGAGELLARARPDLRSSRSRIWCAMPICSMACARRPRSCSRSSHSWWRRWCVAGSARESSMAASAEGSALVSRQNLRRLAWHGWRAARVRATDAP